MHLDADPNWERLKYDLSNRLSLQPSKSLFCRLVFAGAGRIDLCARSVVIDRVVSNYSLDIVSFPALTTSASYVSKETQGFCRHPTCHKVCSAVCARLDTFRGMPSFGVLHCRRFDRCVAHAVAATHGSMSLQFCSSKAWDTQAEVLTPSQPRTTLLSSLYNTSQFRKILKTCEKQGKCLLCLNQEFSARTHAAARF